jgi:hypothetical protein
MRELGMWSELTTFVMGAATGIALPYAVMRVDRKRLRARGARHPWNDTTRTCALFFFGPLSLPAYYWVDRRGWAALFCLVVVGAAFTIQC